MLVARTGEPDTPTALLTAAPAHAPTTRRQCHATSIETTNPQCSDTVVQAGRQAGMHASRVIGGEKIKSKDMSK